MTTDNALTRAGFLKWSPRWNDRDRATLEAMTDEFGGVTFTIATSGYPHVKVRDTGGGLIMDVAKGRVYLKGARRWPGSVPYDAEHDTDEDHHVYLLSTSVARSEGKAAPDPTGGHPKCMQCYVYHPPADDCY